MGLDIQVTLSEILLFFLFLIMVVNIVRRSKTNKNSSSNKLPPGPRKLPLIGNMHHVGTLPHHSLAKLANQYGPIMHIQIGELSCIVISSPEMAKEVMKTHDIIFANRPHMIAAEVISYGCKGMSFSPHGSYWRQMRRICTLELLTPKRVESFRSIREQELSNLVKEISLSEGLPINLSEKIYSLTYGLTSRMALGGKSKDQKEYTELTKDFSKAIGGFSIVDLYPSLKFLQVLTGFRTKLEQVHRGIDRILENIIRDHNDKKLDTKEVDEEGEDLVYVLLRLQKQSDLEYPLSKIVIQVGIAQAKRKERT